MSDPKAQLRQALKSAREAIDKKEWKEALQHCKTALKLDKNNYNVYVFIGLAATELGQDAQAEQSYRRAVALSAANPLAWQGLSKLYLKSSQWQKLAEAYEELIKLTSDEQKKKKRDLTAKLADAFAKAGEREKAIAVWTSQLQGLEGEDHVKESLDIYTRLAALYEEAEEELKNKPETIPEDQERAASEVEGFYLKIMKLNYPNTVDFNVKYATRLQNRLIKTNDSQLKEQLKAEVLDQCKYMIQTQPTSHFPFETLIEASEEDNSDMDENLTRSLSKRFVHKFPHRGLSWVIFGIILTDRLPPLAQHYKYQKARADQKRSYDDCITLIEMGLRDHPTYIRGWIVLADLLLRNGAFQKAIDCVNKGLKYINDKEQKANASLKGAKIDLQLILAKVYQLSKRSSEAEEAYSFVLSLQPDNISALTGMGEINIEHKDDTKAEHFYREVLKYKPEEDAAIAQLGLMKYRAQNYIDATQLFQQAIQIEPQNSLYFFYLGRTYWEMGGKFRSDKKYAQVQFLQSAKLDPDFAGNFTYLGDFYRYVESDLTRAKRCYQKALALSHLKEVEAGVGLSDVYIELGQKTLAVSLWNDITSQSHPNKSTRWAWKNLAFHHLKTKNYAMAVTAFHNTLRVDLNDSMAWKGLSQAYLAQGKYMAALKGFEKALEIDPSCFVSKYQVACTKLLLGLTEEATQQFSAILEVRPSYLPALKGLGQALITAARKHVTEGLFGKAQGTLTKAKEILQQCLSVQNNLQCIWKLLGDIYTLHYHLPSNFENEIEKQKTENIAKAKENKLRLLAEGFNAYEKALEIDSSCAGIYYDLATNCYLRALVLKTHLPLIRDTQQKETEQGNQLLNEAVSWIKKAIALNPQNALYWNTLGIFLTRSLPSISQHAFITAIILNDNDEQTWTNLGTLYMIYGDYELADNAFVKAQSLYPENSSIWSGHALISEAQIPTDPKHLNYAWSCFTQACSLGGNNWESRVGLGYTGYLTGEDLSNALASMDAYMRAHPLDSQSAGGWNILGLLQEARGLLVPAYESFSKALCLLSSLNQEAQSKQDHIDDAFYTLGHSTETGPDTEVKVRRVTLNMARVLTKLGRYKDAIYEYKNAGVGGDISSPRDVILTWELGRALFLDGQIEESTALHKTLLSRLEKANSSGSVDPQLQLMEKETLLLLVQLSYHQGSIPLAKKYVMQCVKKDGSYLGGWQMMSALGALIADYNVAQSAMLQMQKIIKTPSPQLYSMLSLLALLQDKKEEAKRYLCKAVHLRPDDEGLWNSFSGLLLDYLRTPANLRSVCLNASRVTFPRLQHYVGRYRLVAQSLLSLGKNVPSSPSEIGQPGELKLDAGLKAVISDLKKLIHVQPQDKTTWYLFAVASYSYSILNPCYKKCAATAKLLNFILGMFLEERTELEYLLNSLQKASKPAKKGQEGKAADPQEIKAANLSMKMNEEKVFFLRLALCDCHLLMKRGDANNIKKAIAMADEALKSPCLQKGGEDEAFCLRQVARCHLAQKNTEQAIQHYKQALRCKGHKVGLLWSELADIYAEHMGLTEAAELCLKQAVKFYSEAKDRAQQGASLIRLCHLYLRADESMKHSQL